MNESMCNAGTLTSSSHKYRSGLCSIYIPAHYIVANYQYLAFHIRCSEMMESSPGLRGVRSRDIETI